MTIAEFHEKLKPYFNWIDVSHLGSRAFYRLLKDKEYRNLPCEEIRSIARENVCLQIADCCRETAAETVSEIKRVFGIEITEENANALMEQIQIEW